MINNSNNIVTDHDKEVIKNTFILNFNKELIKFNIPNELSINNISEFNSFYTLINQSNETNKVSWMSNELFDFVNKRKLELDILLNGEKYIPVVDNTGFDFTNNSYDLEYEKTKFILNTNNELKTFGVPSNIIVNNISEFNSLKTLIQNFIPNPLNPLDAVSWLNSPLLKTFINNKASDLSDLSDPIKNKILNIQLNINNNLLKFQELLNIDIVPSLDQLNNILDLPLNFDYSKLTGLLKDPNLNIESLQQLAGLLQLPELNLNSFLPNLEIPEIPQFPTLELPKISSLMTGLNFNRMLDTMVESQLKDFPETTDWKSVVKYQAAQVTKSIFEELSKMTLYIEPGEIRVLTTGSAATQQGQNVNRIKIKLK